MKLLVTTLATMLLAIHVSQVRALDYDQCLAVVRGKPWQDVNGTAGGTTNWGERAPLDENTTAITYDLCLRACADPDHGIIKWPVFASQVSAWLFPWFALASQLPFGSEGMWDDLVSLVLVVGSPALAAYSLTFTILNGYWLSRRLRSKSFRPRKTVDAIHILHSLQRFPIQVNPDLLPSLVEDDEWWQYLGRRLAISGTWSFSAATNVAWVVVAYIFSVVTSLTGSFARYVNADGQAVGSVWLWLLAIVIGWLQISTKCDLQEDVRIANKNYRFRRQEHSTIEADEYAISITPNLDDPFLSEASRTGPTFNYMRVLSWIEVADAVVVAFQQEQPTHPHRVAISFRTWCRILNASMFALFLQWGTVGAAAIIEYFTPAVGVGCRCLTYLVYGAMSTIVWLVLVTSSLLHRYAEVARPQERLKVRILRILSVFLRRIGKIFAAINVLLLITACAFQFTGLYDNCWCVGNAMRAGTDNAYLVLEMSPSDIHNLKIAWTGGFFLSILTVGFFIVMTTMFRLTRELLHNSYYSS